MTSKLQKFKDLGLIGSINEVSSKDEKKPLVYIVFWHSNCLMQVFGVYCYLKDAQAALAQLEEILLEYEPGTKGGYIVERLLQ